MARLIKFSDGALAYWKMDSINSLVISDSTGKGNNLTVTGAGATSVTGYVDNGVKITGASTSYLYKNNLLTSNNNFTISGWFKVDPYTSSSWENYLSGITTSVANGIGIAVSTGKKYSINYFNGTVHVEKESSITVTGDWVYLSLVKNNSDVKLFVNGELAVSDTITHNVGLNYFSCYNNSGIIQKVTYTMDELLIWENSLSDAQIKDVYNSYFYTKNLLVLSDNQYKKYNSVTSSWQTVTSSAPTENDYYNGNSLAELSTIPQSAWQQLNGAIELCYYTDDTAKSEIQFNIETNPFTLADELGSSISIIEYTDNPTQETSVITLETEPFSVYDYIGELPTVVAFTEATDDIIISTTTEPFDIYDELGDSVDVLYYTDDVAIASSDLVLEANWSPIDELNGDFEVVTWTDEDPETAQRALEMTAIPKPQFIYSLGNPVKIYNKLKKVLTKDESNITYGTSNLRYLLTNNNTDWYTWDGESFVLIPMITDEVILKDGIDYLTLNAMDDTSYSKWNFDTVNVGVFLADSLRSNIVSSASTVEVKHEYFAHTSELSEASFYILNTTAKIELDFSGLTLTGALSDDDLTRVQYRVKLNGDSYYPSSGEFTALSPSPQNINITLQSEDILIGDWNTLEVEFQDSFGTTDMWSAKFIGKYAGLIFTDPDGNYYSTDVGQVLKYLDFGEILTGQFTPRYEIKIKNEYGYNVKDAKIVANTSNFADGLLLEFSKEDSEIDAGKELLIGSLANGEEFTFYVRLSSTITTVPNGNNTFNIYVMAVRDV